MSQQLSWENSSILDVPNLTMSFGGLVAIEDLSFQTDRQDITAIIGPNGSDKTTVFNCLTGFYKPNRGQISLIHKHNTQYQLERMAEFRINNRALVARTFQNIRLFTGMSVLENLLVAQHHQLMQASWRFFQYCNKGRANKVAPCLAANNKCWPLVAPSWGGQNYYYSMNPRLV